MNFSRLRQKEASIVAEFGQFSSWEDRYRHLITLGKSAPQLPEEARISDNLVKGCQSQVWLVARQDDSGYLVFEADSDALIVKGLVRVLLRVYSEATPQEILSHPPDFIKQLGFDRHLSPSRANGLLAMIRQIQYYAAAYSALQAR